MTLWNPLNVFSGRAALGCRWTVCVLRPLAHRRPSRPASVRPGDRDRWHADRWTGEHGRSASPSDRLRAAGRPGCRAAVPHGDLLQAPPRAAAREHDAGVPGGRRAELLAEPGAGRLGRHRSTALDVGRGRRRRVAAEQSVPFFKREISFRRKKAAAEEEVVRARSSSPPSPRQRSPTRPSRRR